MDYSEVRESIRVRVESNNEKVLIALVKQLRSPLGVIPFLGAGISAPLKYRQWGAFLGSISREQLSAADRAVVDEAITKEDYLRAAGLIAKALGERDFQQAVAEEFSDDRLRDADLCEGSFGFLPLLAAGPVITTNFDRVVENVFERARLPFKERIHGANADEVVPAIQQNRLVLWKIHGDRGDSRTRVLSDDEYDRHYLELPELLLVAFLNRPMLFIGCSLDKDRTTDVLTSIRAKHAASNHYAFLQIPESDDEFDDRLRQLRGMGVRPIWYPKNKHGEIAGHLSDVMHGVSSLPLGSARLDYPRDSPALTAEKAASVLSSQMGELEMAMKSAPQELQSYKQESPPYVPILDKMTRGQVAFFLGAGASMGRLPLGREFYNRLIAEFGDDGPEALEKYGDMEPPRIAQHFADEHGRDALYSQVNAQLAQAPPSPTAIHWFIATLRDRLRAKGFKPSQQWIFTTNYDEWMEYALRLTGEQFHLFTYRVTDPHAGSFVYQSPAGAVHVIDRPSHFRRLPDDGHTVVVKLHGGLHSFVDLPISYVFAHRDFVELAGKVPAAIPRVILDRLAERSLLFLGSGLGDDSVESIVRDMHARDPKKLSWGIQWPLRPEKRLYWQKIGVQLVDITLQTFMLQLNERFEEFQPAKTSWAQG